MFPDLTPRHSPPRLLLVVAHPDDETFGCGSLLLAAADHGWVTTVVCATRGEAGEPAPGIDLHGRPLGEVREGELREAAELLGVSRLVLLDFADSGMDGTPPPGSLCAADPTDVSNAVRAIAAEVDPDVIISLDAADGHRDHARMRDAAAEIAAERSVPAYLQALPRSLMSRWTERMIHIRPEMAHLAYADLGTPDELVAVVVDTTEHLAVREQAIALHRTRSRRTKDFPTTCAATS